jgi:hypothetical protein
MDISETDCTSGEQQTVQCAGDSQQGALQQACPLAVTPGLGTRNELQTSATNEGAGHKRPSAIKLATGHQQALRVEVHCCLKALRTAWLSSSSFVPTVDQDSKCQTSPS